MPKILHAADIHLGAKFSILGPEKATIQRGQIRETLKGAIATALNEKVDIFLFAGDLFDSNQQPQKNVDLVIEQFNLLNRNNIPICLIPGNHDPFDSSSIYRKFNFEERCPNLKIFKEEDIAFKEYPQLDLTIYGEPNLSHKSYISPLKGLKPRTLTKFHVAIAHGSFYIPDKVAPDDHVFKEEEIRNSGMNYIALGHWHRMYPCAKDPPSWYPGPPEWLPDQRGGGGVLLVNLFETGKAKVETKTIGTRNYDEKELNISEIQDSMKLKKEICEGANRNLVRKVSLKGLRNAELMINFAELERELSEEFFYLKILDESSLKIGEISEATYKGRLIMERFIKSMKEKSENSGGEEKEIAESALQYGISLLEGKDIL